MRGRPRNLVKEVRRDGDLVGCSKSPKSKDFYMIEKDSCLKVGLRMRSTLPKLLEPGNWATSIWGKQGP